MHRERLSGRASFRNRAASCTVGSVPMTSRYMRRMKTSSVQSGAGCRPRASTPASTAASISSEDTAPAPAVTSTTHATAAQ